MHRAAHAVPDELTNYAEPVGFHVVLNRARNVVDAIARNSLTDAFVQSLFCDIHQFLGQDAATTHCDRPGGVTDEPVKDDADVEAHDVAKTQNTRASQS